MRIAFLSFYSGHLDRGVETWTHELADKLSGNGYEVTVFQGGTYKKDADYRVVTIPLSVDWKRSKFGDVLFLDYWSILVAIFTLKVIPYLWRERFNIVVPNNGAWQTLLVRIVTWLHRKKMIVVGHAGIGRDGIWNIWNLPDIFVALSKRAKDWACKINPFLEVEQIPNGVDLHKFSPKGKRAAVNLSRPIVLQVGALEHGKRPLETIRAVTKLPNLSLLMVGDGPLKERVQDLGERLLPGRFTLKKFAYEKMPRVYRSVDLLVSPSRSYHSFEIVILEALASNLPVVANNDSIRKEIVGSAGFFTNPEDTKSYANAIGKALKKKWGGNPRNRARQFSWNKIVLRYGVLFNQLLKNQ